MIAIDTSAWIAFFGGALGQDVELVGKALVSRDGDFRHFAAARGLKLLG